MAENVDVRARLTLDAKGAKRQAAAFKGQIMELQRRIRGTQSLATGITSRLLAIGGAYIGITRISQAMMGATRSAMTYTAELEATRIGLTSVLQAVDGGDWESSARAAADVFERLKDESIKSVATAGQMFSIFQGIVGPIRAAGFELETVVGLTRDTVNASTALNVDLAQAQRDIGLMVRGTAGMDVKLFSILRSTGAIKEDTQAWNKNLTAQERVEKLQVALAKFAPAGERFAKSWRGVTSTFKGIRQELARAAFQPVMDTMAKNLGKLNDHLIQNQDGLTKFFHHWGSTVATNMQTAIDHTVRAFKFIIANWDVISARISAVVNRVKELAPTLAKVGIGAVALQVSRPVLAGAVGLAAAPGAVALFGGGAGAAAAAAAPAQLSFGFAGGGAAASGGAAAGAGVGMATLGIIMAALAVAAGVLVAGWELVKENMAELTVIFVNIFQGMGDDILALLKETWRAVKPILKLVAGMFIAWWAFILTGLIPVLRVLVNVMTGLVSIIGDITTAIEEVLAPGFNTLFGWFAGLNSWLMAIATTIASVIGRPLGGKVEPEVAEGISNNFAATGEALGNALMDSLKAPELTIEPFKTPVARGGTVVNNDFKGSRITIKQEFPGKTDPDRVVFAMMKDLTREAEQRTSSAFSGALTR